LQLLECFKDRFQREPYKPKAILTVENTSEGGYLHIHGVVKFKRDAFETIRKLVSDVRPEIRPEDLMRARILLLWNESCKLFKVKFGIRNSDKTQCLKQGRKEELRNYIIKLSKHGISTKAHGLIFKRINLNKKRGNDSEVGLFSNRDDKPSRHNSPDKLVRLFDKEILGTSI
jgi:hypothetical protein